MARKTKDEALEKEIRAMRRIKAALAELDPDARERVLRNEIARVYGTALNGGEDVRLAQVNRPVA